MQSMYLIPMMGGCALSLIGADGDQTAFGARVSAGIWSAQVGDARFSGDGTLPNRQRASFTATGRQLGFETPRGWAVELGLVYLVRPFVVGLSAAGVFAAPADHRPLAPDLASEFDTGHLSAIGPVADAGLTLPAGPLAVELGVRGGVRFLRIPIRAVVPMTCVLRNLGPYACPVEATAVAAYAGPRVGLDVPLGTRAVSPVAGIFASADLAPGIAISCGLTVTFPFLAGHQ